MLADGVLRVVRLCVLHHDDTRRYFDPAVRLLTEMATRSGNLDIADHARFYLRMLTHLSADQLRAVVQAQLGVLATKTSSNALDEHLGIFIN